MVDATQWKWVCDKTEMICCNSENSITVKINSAGKTYNGKLEGMPLELFGKIAQLKHGEKVIENIVRGAEEEFFKTCLGQLP